MFFQLPWKGSLRKCNEFMGKNLIPLLLFLPSLFLLEAMSLAGHPPALFIFGGSEVDCGNNLFLNTTMQSCFEPYGVDFESDSTGRFTNGRTIVDWIDKLLGREAAAFLPDIMNRESDAILAKGMNFASGSAGILDDTGSTFGENWSLEKQISSFNQTLQNDLVRLLNRRKSSASQYLATSIFMVIIASADYVYNYLQPKGYNSSQIYTAEQFSDLLVNKMGDQLKNLCTMGARKVIVFQIGPIGCYPGILENLKPRTVCADDINNMVSVYNHKLHIKAEELRGMFPDARISIAQIFNLIMEFVQAPASLGFKETRKSCCAVEQHDTGLCTPFKKACMRKNQSLFWDDYNLGEAANRLIAENCYIGSKLCTPMNIFDIITSNSRNGPRSSGLAYLLVFVVTIIAGCSSI